MSTLTESKRGFEALPIPLLIEHFTEAVAGDPERQEQAGLALDALRKFVVEYGTKHKANSGALFLAAMVFAQNMLAYAAYAAAEAEEKEEK